MTIERPLARLLAAEFVGTFALVFAGCGAIMVDAKTGALGHVGVAISFGLVIMVMVYAVGHISGAHFNPAVTVAFALSRHFPRRRLLGYWAAQLLGALAAAAILRGSLGNVADVGATLPSGSQPVVPLGADDDVLPDVRDHGRHHGYARRGGGSRDRDRRHRRPRRHVRRPHLGRLHESGPLDRPCFRLRRPARTLALHPRSARGRRVGRARLRIHAW